MLFALFLAGALAAGTELLLLGHFEDRPQWIPLVLLALGLVWGGVTVATPRHWSVRTFQVLMAAFAASGFIGQYLHYRGNVAFELEMYPALKGLDLFWEAIRGATPSLAPGTMTVLGAIGLLYAYRHPALRAGDESETTTGKEDA
jgi:hypothetical protein